MSRDVDAADRSKDALQAACQALALLEVVCRSDNDLLRAAAVRSRAALSVAIDAVAPTSGVPLR